MTKSILNTNLNKAAKAKNDEFYTRLEDIEKELQHYKNHFENKIVYCNCDNPEWSNFYKYFHDNFKSLKLKKIITTHYDANEEAYIYEYDGERYIKTYLFNNGDFRSDECIAILKKADIVVTNPPFSIFREHVTTLLQYNKKFLIIGSNLAVSNKIIFNEFKNGRMWLGINSGSIKFKTPANDFKNVNINWYTNLKHKKNRAKIALSKTYNSKDYPMYENSKFQNVINVNKIKDIPKDYSGVMGVPVNFIVKHNPNQFELIDILNNPLIKGREIFKRMLIRNKGLSVAQANNQNFNRAKKAS